MEAWSAKDGENAAPVLAGERKLTLSLPPPSLPPSFSQEPLRTKTMAKEKIYYKKLPWSTKLIGQPVGPLKGKEAGREGGREGGRVKVCTWLYSLLLSLLTHTRKYILTINS